MANDIKLGDSHPLTDNLYPLKVGGEVSSLEIANGGSGARVTGDLEIAGDLDVIGELSSNAYNGKILGYTALGIDSADATYTVTTSFVVIHTTLNVTFIAPPGGNVEIFVNLYVEQAATGRSLFLGLSDASSYSALDVTHEHLVHKGDETDDEQIQHYWVITGLTAGTSYKWYLGAKTTSASGYKLYWGGDATGEYAPFIMKTTALPATINTG